MLVGKINVKAIDKARLFEGKKGTYLDIVLIPTPNSEYSDYMIKQSVSKEEREAGVDIILGNVSILSKKEPQQEPQQKDGGDSPVAGDLPF